MTSRIGQLACLALLCALAAPVSAQPDPDTTPTLRATIAQGRTLAQGAEGTAVRELQRRLAGLGFTLSVDADFGPTTDRTVKAFQKVRGLTIDGVVGSGTLSALDDAAAHPSLRRGAEGDTVEELQRLLNNAGQRLTVDGDYGPATEAGVLAYQRATSGLSATGVADAATFAKLRQRAARRDSLVDGIGGTTPPTNPQPSPAVQRPTARSSTAEAYARGLAWARAANAAGRHTLIVNFEGLWSFSDGFAEKVYTYHRDLLRGRRPRAPTNGSMSFMAKRVIAPNLARHAQHVEVLLLPETSESGSTSVGETTVRAFHQVHGARLKLIVTGHSFGGYAALRLANKLRARGIQVSGMLTVDARTTPGNYRHFIRPDNVQRHHNDYHKGLFLPGYEIQGASNLKIRGVTHGSIVSHATVREHYLRLVER